MLRTRLRQAAVLGTTIAVLAWAAPTPAEPPQPQAQARWAFAEAPHVVVVAEGQPIAQVRPENHAVQWLQAQTRRRSDYFIGLGCEPVPDALRSHLGLKEGQGLLIEQVLPDSPAAAAKLERFDVLVKAGDKPLANVPDLVAAVDAAKDKKMVLELYRRGKSMKVEVTPAKTAGEFPSRFSATPAEIDIRAHTGAKFSEVEAEIRRALDEAKKAGQAMPHIVLREIKPGWLLPPGSPNVAALPSNVSISVTKKGGEPTKITVSRGDQKWEITENELDKLPTDLRPSVERTLAGLTMRAHGNARMQLAGPPVAPPHVAPATAPPKEPDGLQKKLDQLDRKIDELRKSLDEFRASGPGKVEKK
jgi:hypothetical protein